jgi:hypothetical protein
MDRVSDSRDLEATSHKKRLHPGAGAGGCWTLSAGRVNDGLRLWIPPRLELLTRCSASRSRRVTEGARAAGRVAGAGTPAVRARLYRDVSRGTSEPGVRRHVVGGDLSSTVGHRWRSGDRSALSQQLSQIAGRGLENATEQEKLTRGALLTMRSDCQLIATRGNGFRRFEPFLRPLDLPVVATVCDRSAS